MTQTLIALWTPAQTAVLAAFSFALGAAIGSFLNVVVYRLAHGLSLVRPPSHCPSCKTPIRARDNLPVLAWIILRGKCRACGQPFSARYPLVEFVAGLMFLSLAWLGPLGEGGYVPRPAPSLAALPHADTLAPDLRFDQPRLWTLYAWHTLLLCWLLCRALWERDAILPPRRAQAFFVTFGIFCAALLPWLHPVPVSLALPHWLGQQRWAVGLLNGLIGAAVGGVLGLLAAPATGATRWGVSGRLVEAGSLTVIGLMLGWQAVCGIAVITAAIQSLIALFRPAARGLATVGYGDCLLVVAWGWMLAWQRIVIRLDRLGYAGDYSTLATAGLAVLFLSFAAWMFRAPAKSVQAR